MTKVTVEKKAKIGQKVKSIPEVWTKRQKVTEDDTPEEAQWKETMNHILLDRRAYFFKYRYSKSRQEWKEYENQKEIACCSKFNCTIDQLRAMEERTQEQEKWLEDYAEYAPLIDSDSPMNLVCHWIEGIDFAVKNKVKSKDVDWTIYLSDECEVPEEEKEEIIKAYNRHLKDVAAKMNCMQDVSQSESDAMVYKQSIRLMREKIGFVCGNPRAVTNVLVEYLYETKPSASKTLLWDAYGRYMVDAARSKSCYPLMFPMPDPEGDIEYLGKTYKMSEVCMND